MRLTVENSKEILSKHVTEPHLITHALAVSSAMGSMAARFGGDAGHWRAIGWLHDVDYEAWPEEHLKHTRELLEPEGVDEEDIHAILSHGWGVCNDIEPQSDMEKCLYTVDELTGIIQACARMRPMGITDLEAKSAIKKFKDKSFAAKCDRELILTGCGMLGLELSEVIQLCIDGMKPEAEALGLGPRQ